MELLIHLLETDPRYLTDEVFRLCVDEIKCLAAEAKELGSSPEALNECMLDAPHIQRYLDQHKGRALH